MALHTARWCPFYPSRTSSISTTHFPTCQSNGKCTQSVSLHSSESDSPIVLSWPHSNTCHRDDSTTRRLLPQPQSCFQSSSSFMNATATRCLGSRAIYKTSYSHSSASPWTQKSCVKGDALTPRATVRSRISASRGITSIWLLFCPDASYLVDQRTSLAALARGQMSVSRFIGSIVSVHTATSPPITSLASSSDKPALGSCEYTSLQLLVGPHQSLNGQNCWDAAPFSKLSH